MWRRKSKDNLVQITTLPKPRDFSFWCRFKEAVWLVPTEQAERVFGIMAMLRGIWMLNPWWYSIPIEVQGNLIPSGFTEPQWGTVLLLFGTLQFGHSGLRGTWVRNLAATALAVIQSAASIGYWRSDLFFRGVVPFILTMVIFEIWIAWRALYDRRMATRLEERRDGD